MAYKYLQIEVATRQQHHPSLPHELTELRGDLFPPIPWVAPFLSGLKFGAKKCEEVLEWNCLRQVHRPARRLKYESLWSKVGEPRLIVFGIPALVACQMSSLHPTFCPYYYLLVVGLEAEMSRVLEDVFARLYIIKECGEDEDLGRPSGVDQIASNGMMKELESGSFIIFSRKANSVLQHAEVDGQRRRERVPVNGIHQYLETPGTLHVAVGEHDLLSVKTGLSRLDSGLDRWYL